MKKICCELCGKILDKKEGIRNIEIRKISDESFVDYPQEYDANFLLEYDICLRCFLQIQREINRIKNIGNMK